MFTRQPVEKKENVPMLSLLELRVRERSELGKIAAQRRPVRAVPQLLELEVVARDWVEAGEGLVADPLVVLVLGAPLVLILPTQRGQQSEACNPAGGRLNRVGGTDEVGDGVERDQQLRLEESNLCGEPQT